MNIFLIILYKWCCITHIYTWNITYPLSIIQDNTFYYCNNIDNEYLLYRINDALLFFLISLLYISFVSHQRLVHIQLLYIHCYSMYIYNKTIQFPSLGFFLSSPSVGINPMALYIYWFSFKLELPSVFQYICIFVIHFPIYHIIFQ